MTDEQLALAVQAGDTAAAETLVRRYRSLAYALAWPYVTLLSDSDDMRQEALLAIVSAASSFRVDGGASFNTLVRLAIRRRLFTVITADNRMRRKAVDGPLSINTTIEGADGDDLTLDQVIPDPFAVDPHDALIRSERLAAFVRAVEDDLSPMERAALVAMLNGATLVETFDRIGRPSIARRPDGRQRPKTAENALDRARRKLRVALEEPRPLGAAA